MLDWILVIILIILSYKLLLNKNKIIKINYKRPIQANDDWNGKLLENPSIFAHNFDKSLLNGKNVSNDYITCYDPSTGQFIDAIKAANEQDIKSQIQLAKAAQVEWKSSNWSRRLKVLNSLLDWVVSDIDNLVDVACRDTGKTKVDAAFGEILTTAEKLRWMINNAKSILSPQRRHTNLLLAHKSSKVVYEPLGVTVASVSWNYPAHNSLSPIIASLISGNACIVKGSELVAWSTKWFIGAAQECLRVNGEDPNLIQLVICYPEVVETLTTSNDIDHITFIGSELVGKKVASAASKNLKPCCIELGGKDPAIILESADLNFFESTFMRSAFQAAGQNCIGIERFIIHEKIYTDFIERMDKRVKELRLGPSLKEGSCSDVGAMISDTRFAKLEELIQNAIKQGARLLVGGKRYQHPLYPKGHYFEPTLLVDVTKDMEIFHEELFAPVMTVIKAQSTNHAIDLANGTRFGLGAAVFGNNKAECRLVSENLKCGMVSLNDFGVFYLNQSMPFGGVKSSGYGRFGGPEGLQGLCNPKVIIEDRFFSLIRTPIPKPLDYPIKSAVSSWSFVKGLVEVVYATEIKAKILGLKDLLKGL
ncbi:putative meiotic recombination-related protein [Wallemia mellicola]|uniref:Meiotic recombination-related protein n=1 Tax=Wallemia mellicola TaxID=1708541 RepID=A0A4T0PAR9_9BASI|nr:putative meiotic recombination-related protein [Wallemia mellicola]TIB99747.1 putative meiotic recombination-related protein [Wallemia mellicola]TIC04194.1 putative meiotic recombination-related protein [Wallemia mellicola]TIC07555.1 putative meiotic recombination-related protein [Wallemia mellicola]TIC14718.1 putative meiotic recombination-related protein [Wallemia mellicola]